MMLEFHRGRKKEVDDIGIYRGRRPSLLGSKFTGKADDGIVLQKGKFYSVFKFFVIG